MDMMSKHKKLLIFVLLLLVLGLLLWLYDGTTTDFKNPISSITHSKQTSKQSSGFDKHAYSINDPASLWVVVNKGRVLPSSYVPAGLVIPNISLRVSGGTEMEVRSDTAKALETMFTAAKAQGIDLMLASGYRPYSEQVTLYNGYVSSDGQAAADASSARPGHSEHQTGLAADLEPVDRKCEVDQCFEQTPEGQWLAANDYKYGFIIRYPKGKESVTGYEYEPWHVRYVGVALSTELHDTGQTLEEFFGLPFYADYPSSSYQLQSGL